MFLFAAAYITDGEIKKKNPLFCVVRELNCKCPVCDYFGS